MRIKLSFRTSAAINVGHCNSSGCRTFCKKTLTMVTILLPSVVALRSSVEHDIRAIYDQISVTFFFLLNSCYFNRLILLTSTKWWAPVSASKWRMGFNSAFKGLTLYSAHINVLYDGFVLHVLLTFKHIYGDSISMKPVFAIFSVAIMSLKLFFFYFGSASNVTKCWKYQ
jgi:hypothetical protein